MTWRDTTLVMAALNMAVWISALLLIWVSYGWRYWPQGVRVGLSVGLLSAAIGGTISLAMPGGTDLTWAVASAWRAGMTTAGLYAFWAAVKGAKGGGDTRR